MQCTQVHALSGERGAKETVCQHLFIAAPYLTLSHKSCALKLTCAIVAILGLDLKSRCKAVALDSLRVLLLNTWR